MNKKGMGNVVLFFLFFALVIGISVNSNPNFDIKQIKDSLNWTHIEINLTESPDLGNAIEDIMNGLGSSIFHIAKYVAQLSYDNPNVPYKLILWLLILSISFPILIGIFKFSIIFFILFKEYLQSRKDKKRLKMLKIKKLIIDNENINRRRNLRT